MSIIDRFIKTKGLSTWDTGGVFFNGSKGSHLSIVDMYKLAYDRVNVIARTVSGVEVSYKRRNKDVLVSNHALINLFNKPSGDDELSFDEFIYSVVASTQIADDTFILFEYSPNSKYPVSVRTAYFGEVTTDTDQNKRVIYRIGAKKLDDREFIKISGYSPISRITGISPVSTIKNYLSAEQLVALHQIGFFENGAIPSGALVIEADKATFEQVKEAWENKFKGSGKNNQLAFIRKDPSKGNAIIDYKQYTTDNRNLDLQVLFDRIDDKLDRAFGVPKEMMGDITATNLAGVKMAKAIYWENVGGPIAKKIYQKMNAWIDTYFSDDIMLYPNIPNIRDEDEEKLDADLETSRVDNAIKLVDAGYDYKEVFEYYGLPVFKKLPSSEVKSIVQLSTKKTDNLVIKATDVTPEDVADDISQIKDIMIKHTDSQFGDIKDLDDFSAYNETSYSIALAASLAPMIIKLYEKVGKKQLPSLLADMGLPLDTISFSIDTSFRTGLTAYTDRLASGFEASTKADVKALIETANALEWSETQLKAELRKYYKAQGEYIQEGGRVIKNNVSYRIDRLTRTENIRANNMASLKSMQDIQDKTGKTIRKVWSTSGDSSVCPICATLNGKTIGLERPYMELGEVLDLPDDGMFTNTHVTMHTPGAHPNCRCHLSYIIS